MFKRIFTIGTFLVLAVATVLVTPDTGQAQRYFGRGYVVGYPSYYQPYGYGVLPSLLRLPALTGPYYGYPEFTVRITAATTIGYPGYFGAYPAYGYYPNGYIGA